MQRPIPRLFAMTFALVACSDRPTATGPIPTSPSASAVKFWDDNAAVYWNGVANSLAVKYAKSPFETIRNFGIVSVAGYNAAVAAEKAGTGAVHPSAHAAISAASTVALTYLFPGEAAALETRLDEYLAADGWPGNRNTDVASGEAIGRDIAAQVVTRAQGDRFFAPWTGTVPTGPGIWFSATPPVGPMWGQMKPYFLLSGDQFRPPPPPAFGSPEFPGGARRGSADCRHADCGAGAHREVLGRQRAGILQCAGIDAGRSVSPDRARECPSAGAHEHDGVRLHHRFARREVLLLAAAARDGRSAHQARDPDAELPLVHVKPRGDLGRHDENPRHELPGRARAA